MNLQILPLAITMMAGPAIMAAIVLVTHPQAVRVSVAYLVGVAVGTAAGVAIMLGLASLLGDNVELGDSSEKGAAGTIIQFALVGLLVAAAIKNYVRRETIEPPKWLGALMQATQFRALAVGLLVILLGPSDIVVMLTVGTHLAQAGAPFTDAFPFIGATVLVAALPLLGFVIFHRRAVGAMPTVRDWIKSHAWLVNIAVCCIFILLIVA